MNTPLKYNGREIKAPTEVKQNLLHLLRVIASRERDLRKVNLRTFQRVELVKKRGLHLPIGNILEAFEALENISACKISTGSEGRREIVLFKESARQVARKILGIAKEFNTEHLTQAAPAPGSSSLDAAREILLADMPDAAKVKVLKSLLLPKE